jgi:hypothetical protein
MVGGVNGSKVTTAVAESEHPPEKEGDNTCTSRKFGFDEPAIVFNLNAFPVTVGKDTESTSDSTVPVIQEVTLLE